jgi:hypothetical protein
MVVVVPLSKTDNLFDDEASAHGNVQKSGKGTVTVIRDRVIGYYICSVVIFTALK